MFKVADGAVEIHSIATCSVGAHNLMGINKYSWFASAAVQGVSVRPTESARVVDREYHPAAFAVGKPFDRSSLAPLLVRLLELLQLCFTYPARVSMCVVGKIGNAPKGTSASAARVSNLYATHVSNN